MTEELMNPHSETYYYIWQTTGQYVFQYIWRGKKGKFITFTDDTNLGREDDMVNTSLSIPKDFQELERWPKH